MLTSEATAITLNTALGLIKLNKRIDLLWAEKTALETPLALPLPKVVKPPTQPQMRRALSKLLDETKNKSPDPLGTDRSKIIEAVESNPDNVLLFGFMQKYLPKQALGKVLDQDGKFIKELREARPDLAEDPDVEISAFYIGAGKDVRTKSYTWRLALTVIDAFADFGAEHTDLLVRDKNLQSVVSSILTRFGDANTQTTDSTSQLLKIVLSSTLNGVLDKKTNLEIDNRLLDSVLDALVDARSSLPIDQQDNFIAGLLQGKSYPLLVSKLLEEGATSLTLKDSQNLRAVAGSFLEQLAIIVQQKPSFNDFFQDNWGDILRAGLSSIEQHGPSLLKDSDPLLQQVLVSVVGNLSRSPNNKFLTTDLLVGIVDSVISTVAANPDDVQELVKQEWLGALISSISTTIARDSIRDAFSKKALDSMIKETLITFAEHPELIIDKPGLARDLLREMLDSLSGIKSLSVEALASVGVSSALKTLVKHPQLVNSQYTVLVASLAEKLASLIEGKQLTKVQGSDILQSLTEAIAENPTLFLETEKRFADFIIDASVKVSSNSNGVLSGTTLIKSIEHIFKAVSNTGNAALKNHPAAGLSNQLEKILTAGLDRAEKEMGNQMSMSMVPDVLGNLVEAWAKGEISTLDPANDNFRRVFTDIISKTVA